MRIFFLGFVAFAGALAVTWAGTMAAYVIGNEVGFWHDRDGGVAMGFAFMIGPVLGFIAGCVAALLVVIRARRRASARSGPIT